MRIGKLVTHDPLGVARSTSSDVEVSGGAVATFVLIIGAISPAVTAVTDVLLKPLAQKSTAALDSAKLSFERRKVATELYQKILKEPDATKRQMLVRFLIGARLVDDEGRVTDWSSDRIPQWPAVAGSPP